MLPTTLDGWTLEVVTHLLSKGCFETERLEFKEVLSTDDGGKLRLRKTCCAFANSVGGFVIFGIDDDATLPTQQRLVGITPNPNFYEHFGNQPKQCSPTVAWEGGAVPILLNNGNMLPIIYIPTGWRAPHACKEKTDGAWEFYKRTNKGNEPMSVEEVRHSVVGVYEKRRKFNLLIGELRHINAQAQHLFTPNELLEARPVLRQISTNVIADLLSDLYTVLMQEAGLVEDIQSLRRTCLFTNDHYDEAQSILLRHMSNTEYASFARRHNLSLRIFSGQIQEYCRRLMDQLERIQSVQ